MPLPVKLRDVVDEMEIQSDEWKAYINRKTGELISISEEEEIGAEGFDGEDDDHDEDRGGEPAGQDGSRPAVEDQGSPLVR